MNWIDFLHVDGEAISLGEDLHCTLYLGLLNACLLKLYLLDPWQQPEGSYEIGSVHPSIMLSLGCFLGIGSLGFSEFRHCTRNL